MDANTFAQSPNPCGVCLDVPSNAHVVVLKCSHTFCSACVVKYIETLRSYNLLRPEKLCCLGEECSEQIDDQTISRLFPGETGFIFNLIKKRYRQSQDPNIVIFDCKGYTGSDRKPLIPKPNEATREHHSKAINQLVLAITRGQHPLADSKTCKSILSYNKSVAHKEKMILCYTCGCSYCLVCAGLTHEGSCTLISEEDKAIIHKKSDRVDGGIKDDLQNFIQQNGILRCLNEKCGVAIAKEEGCFWVKCRCSWEMCYPCQKLWGDCEHFAKYPYKKFVPPPAWMVKALNLY